MTTPIVSLSSSQTALLVQGLESIAQRLQELQTDPDFGAEMVALGEPMSALLDPGRVLSADWIEQLAVSLSGPMDVATLKAQLLAAVSSGGELAIGAITDSIGEVDGRQVLWLRMDLSVDRTLVDYSLDLGQQPSGDSSSPSLKEQGFQIGEIEVDLLASFSAGIEIGLVLDGGVPADQALLLRVDGMEVCVGASATLPAVEASYGILGLGPTDVALELDYCLDLSLQDGDAGYLTLGTLGTEHASSLFAVSRGGDGLELSLPFTLDIGGFSESGDSLELGLVAADGFDLGSLSLDFPELTGTDGAAFDFTKFKDISLSDLGAYLLELEQLLPNLGDGLELPLLDQDLGSLLDFGAELQALIDSLRDPSGSGWSFTSVQDLIGRMASALGMSSAEFGLRWSHLADAVEWDLPLSLDMTGSAGFSATDLVPEGSPLALSGQGDMTVRAMLELHLSGGVAIASSAGVSDITAGTLLSQLNGGMGLTTRGLLTDEAGSAVNDIVFSLRDGSSLGVDLNALDLGDGSSADPGTATVADLLALLNATGKVEALLVDNHLELSDKTSGSASFAVNAPTLTISVGSGSSAATSQLTSVAPLMLGLWVAADAPGHITGLSLESWSLRDRLYLNAQPLVSGSLEFDGQLEGGAALGPLSLSIVEGELEARAGWTASLVDPATGADDGRIYWSELDQLSSEGQLDEVLEHGLEDSELEGIFQLQVTPSALSLALGIGDESDPYGDYSENPVDLDGDAAGTSPDTAKVPYIELHLASDGEMSDWSVTAAPSEKLASLFGGTDPAAFDWGELEGLRAFSLDDLPALLELLIGELEETPLWGIEIPLLGMSIGELLRLREAVAGLELPDLPALFDGSSGSDGLADWKLELDAAFEAALPDFSGDFADWGSRLQGLQWSFNRLVLDWEGRTPGDEAFEAEFLIRLGAWTSEFRLALGEFDLALEGSASPPTSLSALALDLSGLLDFIDSVPFGIDGFASLLEQAIGSIAGISVNVEPDFSLDAAGLPRLVFDISATFDPTVAYSVDLEALPLDDTFLLQFEQDGSLALLIGGSLNARVGWDFATMTPVFDPAATQAALQLSIDDTGDDAIEGLVLGVSLGGLAEVSVGSTETGRELATVSLTTSDGLGPATFGLDATGALTVDALLEAHFPLYVDLFTEGEDEVSIDFMAQLELSSETGTTPTFDFEPPAINGNLADLFGGDIGANGWLDGALLFLQGLRNLLETELVGSLPYLGDIDLSSDGFLARLEGAVGTLAAFDSPADLYEGLAAKFETTAGLTDWEMSVSLAGVALEVAQKDVADSDQYSLWTSTFDQLYGGTPIPYGESTLALAQDSEFLIQFDLTFSDVETLDAAAIDLGLDSLGISLLGADGLELTASYTLRVGLGWSPDRGFFVEEADGSEQELEANLTLALQGASLEAKLGPLTFGMSDADPDANEFEASIGIDLADGSLDAGGLTAAQQALDEATVTVELDAGLEVDLEASLFGAGPGLGLTLSAGYGSTSDHGPVTLSYSNGTGGLDLTEGEFYFEISDAYINLGDLLGQPVRELLEQAQQAFEPLEPVVELLTGEVPLISDLSEQIGNGPVTFVDAIAWFGDGADSAREFIYALDRIGDLIASIDTSGSGVQFSLGGLKPKAGQDVYSGGAAEASDFGPNEDSAADDFDSVAAEDSILSDLSALGLSFPILSDPAGNLFGLLFGQDVALIEWDIPDLDASFDFRQSFPIFPPLYVTLFGGVSFQTDFDLGYDTRGIRMMLGGGDAGDLLNGLYLVDNTGNELSMTATIGAGAELNVVVAQAGVEGGLKGELGADLKDPDEDGKVHLDELLYNLSLGPECIFDYSGSLGVFLSAYIKVGIDTPFGFVTLYKDRFKLAEATLVDWSLVSCPPQEPELAVLSGGVLTLNMGDLAVNVLPGETQDGDEVFLVDVIRDESGSVVTGSGAGIRITAYHHTQDFVGVTKVVFDAGLGNDTVIFTPEVTVEVEGRGGEGNDNLAGGSGSNRLWGDEGSDVLSGRAAADTLDGGDGDDYLYGYGGSDSLSGGEGEDELYGDDDLGDMAAFVAANPDFNAGDAGADMLLGGSGDDLLVAGEGDDSVKAGEGDDAVLAGAGNDTVEGEGGNDQIHGEAGDDLLWGDDQAETVTGGSAELHADKVMGGSGFNRIWGGTGDDLLYAADDELLASAPAVSGPGGWSSHVYGGDGADMVYGTAGRDSLEGGFESDYIESGQGADLVLGGPGADALIAAGGAATLLGGHGNDVIDGGDGANWIEGGPGDDDIYARGGADTVHGGTTALGYGYLQQDMSGERAVADPLHGGFSASPAADSCGPEIGYHPEVYAATHDATLKVFNDSDRDGVRDGSEGLVDSTAPWRVTLLTDPDGEQLWQGALTGGDLILPDLPDGSYWVLIEPDSGNGWQPVSYSSYWGILAIEDGLQTLKPELGWYSTGDITGQVKKHEGAQDKDGQPAAGSVVFIDADRDGDWDDGEAYTSTDASGRYVFEGLAAGSYSLAVAEAGVCAPSDDRTAEVVVQGGQQTKQDFKLVDSPYPVVSKVSLGYGVNQLSWLPVPDGSQQLDPIDTAEAVSRIAIEFCSDRGVLDASVTASLKSKSGPDATYALKLVSSTLNRLEFAIDRTDAALPDGRYELTLVADTVSDSSGNLLDGDWRYAQAYASGDGSAGGDFRFEFLLGDQAPRLMMLEASDPGETAQGSDPGVTSLAATSSPVLELSAGTSVLQGMVWANDSRSAELGHDEHEVGLPGQVVEVRDQSGAVVATVITGALDLDGDGDISAGEQGAFRVSGLEAGLYSVSQVQQGIWVQEVAVGSGQDQWFSIASSANAEASTLSALGFMSGVAKVEQQWPVQQFRARDIAQTDDGQLWLIGKGLDGKGRLLQLDPPGAGSVKIRDIELPAALKAGLVGLDALDSEFLLAVADDASVLRYSVKAGTWSELGKLADFGGRYLYPVGDVAMAGPNDAYVIATSSKSSGDQPPSVSGGQLLVHFDPRSLQVFDVNPVVSETGSPKVPLLGLEYLGGTGLLALDSQGVVHAIDAASGWLGASTRVQAHPDLTIGGLSRTVAEGEARLSAGPVVVKLGKGDAGAVGFGNRPDGVLLLDGDDSIDGGCGPEADLLLGDDGSNLPAGVRSEGGNDSIRGRDGNDTLVGGLQGDLLFGEGGNDSITGGTEEANRILGGDGDDSLLGGRANDYILGGDGQDSADGQGGDDWILGQAGNDRILGQQGRDLLVGGAGDDTVEGGAGDDTLIVVNQAAGPEFSAEPYGTGAGRYDGGADFDQLVVSREGESDPVSILLTDTQVSASAGRTEAVSGIEHALLSGGEGDDRVDASAFSGSTWISGHGGADTLLGALGVDVILGGDGDDSMTSSKGDDTLAGGSGSNWLAGGQDDDLYLVAASSDGEYITEASGEGQDTIDASAATDTVRVSIESGSYASSSGALSLQLSGEFEKLLLGSGDDQLELADGVLQPLSVEAGSGEDRISYQDWSSSVVVDLASGAATGLAGLSGFEHAVGGQGNDTLTGSAAGNELDGQAGADSMAGGDGNDTLLGGSGNDSLKGEAGNDLLQPQDGSDAVSGGPGNDSYYLAGTVMTQTLSEAITGGQDILDFSAIDEDLVFQLTPVSIEAATSGGDTVTAKYASEIESILGGNRKDSFAIAATTHLPSLLIDGGSTAGADFDKLNQLEYSAYHLAVQVDLASAVDFSINAVGSATGLKGVVNLRHVTGSVYGDKLQGGNYPVWFEGGDGNDTLVGSVQADRLDGGAGQDILSGLYGYDSLDGGADDDLLQVQGSANTVTGGAGNDRLVFSSLSSGATQQLTDFASGDRIELADLAAITSVGEGSGAALGLGQVEYQVGASKTAIRVGLDAVAGADATLWVPNWDAALALNHSANELYLASGAFSATGMVYHWKNHALLSGTEVVALDQGSQLASSQLFDLRGAQYDPAAGRLTVEIWVNPSAKTESFAFTVAGDEAYPASFTSALGSAGWTLTSEKSFSGELMLAGFGTGTGAAPIIGATRLGELSLKVPAGDPLARISFQGISIGDQLAASQVMTLKQDQPLADGKYQLDFTGGSYSVSVHREAVDSGSALTSADALAALRMAVGINPNPDPDGAGPLKAKVVSPYQFIAADVNQDGRVTAADALSILKMAVGRPDAPSQEWWFVSEEQDFWNDSAAAFSTTRKSIKWDQGAVIARDTDVNWVGVLKGDVDGSWKAPSDSQTLESVYFEKLAELIGVPVEQWG